MDIKKANVNLLLGKIRTHLKTQPDEKKKGKKFLEADKALARLEKLFAGKGGELQLVACGKKGEPVIPAKAVGLKSVPCGKKGEPVIPAKVGGLKSVPCGKGDPIINKP